ncbi:nitroreductase family protein [Aureispira anguillae]|uniref:Nitroreductase n=1 Tax=Aureispira anguillae TaxID=2864201 RepID=A0A915YDR7_9BACT|nr:nitroreductase [Aureispira anguillae]BDS11218.1 nitroreductase [Aureispira anguillae]
MKGKTKLELLTDVIRTRRSIYADDFLEQEIPDEIIKELIVNATWAPNYKCTEPWRFVVLRGKHRKELGKFMLDFYQREWSEKDFPPTRYEHTLNYPQNATMVVIIMQRSKKVKIQEWEELAAVACAVQNLWLSCAAQDIGGYWDSSAAAILYGANLGLKEHERCLGIFYMGYYDLATTKPKGKRKLLRKKLSWLA